MNGRGDPEESLTKYVATRIFHPPTESDVGRFCCRKCILFFRVTPCLKFSIEKKAERKMHR